MAEKWSPRLGLTAAGITAICSAGLIYLVGMHVMSRGAGIGLIVFACMMAIVTLLASIFAKGGRLVEKRQWSAILQPEPLAKVFLAVLAGVAMISTIVGLVDPVPASPPEPRIMQAIGGSWGEPACTVVYRFHVQGRALMVDGARQPSGTPPFHLLATITNAQDDVLEVRGEDPPTARGKAATFTYVTNGRTERLTWDDQTGPVPLELDRCGPRERQ